MHAIRAAVPVWQSGGETIITVVHFVSRKPALSVTRRQTLDTDPAIAPQVKLGLTPAVSNLPLLTRSQA